WYPKIQSQRSRGIQAAADLAQPHEGKLTREHLAFLDLDAIYFELQRFKNERAWYNLSLSRQAIRELLESPDWYRLLIPEDELVVRSFEQVRLWQEIAVALLRKYCDRYYKFRKSEYEQPFLEYRDLTENDPNFIDEYQFLIDRSQTAIVEKLKQLKKDIADRKLHDLEVDQQLRAILFDRHLYEPLIYLKSDLIEVRPVALNEGERNFVLDLRAFYSSDRAFFADKELYLLRNQSRDRGIGFFEAGNFYPDFILWLLVAGRQYVTFVDPKGIRNLRGTDDPKIRFCETIKQLEARLGDPAVILSSYILSGTPYQQVSWWDRGISKAELEACHVLFQKDDKPTYIGKMLRSVVQS
ncbi:MAG: DEAD/DEAH box helicase family protein, partial [Chloroflexota bacterium]